MGLSWRTCMVCGGPKTRGVVVLGSFLCDGCHEAMASLPGADARYDWYVSRLAAWWKTVLEGTASPPSS